MHSNLTSKYLESATIAGRSVTINEAIAEAARRWFCSTLISTHRNGSTDSFPTQPCNRFITGAIQTVETTRAVVGLASLSGAVIDRTESESTFRHVLAVQRSGMSTASMGEIRFRSDCIFVVGDESCLEQTPLLIENLTRLQQADALGRFRAKRIVALGRWSSEGVKQLRANNNEVFAIWLEPQSIPRMLHQLSQISNERLLQSKNTAARWIAEADYLSVVWCNSSLGFEQSDLWIESLYAWIIKENARRRVVGLPISGSGITFQQACTWLTGFPGRIRLLEGNVAYDPELFTTDNYLNKVDNVFVLKVDESLPPSDDFGKGDDGSKRQSVSRNSAFADILIAPSPDSSLSPSGVFIPCSIAGFESAASMFRADGVVSVHVASTSRVTLPSDSTAEIDTFETLRPMSAHEAISRLQIGVMNLCESHDEALE